VPLRFRQSDFPAGTLCATVYDQLSDILRATVSIDALLGTVSASFLKRIAIFLGSAEGPTDGAVLLRDLLAAIATALERTVDGITRGQTQAAIDHGVLLSQVESLRRGQAVGVGPPSPSGLESEEPPIRPPMRPMHQAPGPARSVTHMRNPVFSADPRGNNPFAALANDGNPFNEGNPFIPHVSVSEAGAEAPPLVASARADRHNVLPDLQRLQACLPKLSKEKLPCLTQWMSSVQHVLSDAAPSLTEAHKCRAIVTSCLDSILFLTQHLPQVQNPTSVAALMVELQELFQPDPFGLHQVLQFMHQMPGGDVSATAHLNALTTLFSEHRCMLPSQSDDYATVIGTFAPGLLLHIKTQIVTHRAVSGTALDWSKFKLIVSQAESMARDTLSAYYQQASFHQQATSAGNQRGANQGGRGAKPAQPQQQPAPQQSAQQPVSQTKPLPAQQPQQLVHPWADGGRGAGQGGGGAQGSGGRGGGGFAPNKFQNGPAGGAQHPSISVMRPGVNGIRLPLTSDEIFAGRNLIRPSISAVTTRGAEEIARQRRPPRAEPVIGPVPPVSASPPVPAPPHVQGLFRSANLLRPVSGQDKILDTPFSLTLRQVMGMCDNPHGPALFEQIRLFLLAGGEAAIHTVVAMCSAVLSPSTALIGQAPIASTASVGAPPTEQAGVPTTPTTPEAAAAPKGPVGAPSTSAAPIGALPPKAQQTERKVTFSTPSLCMSDCTPALHHAPSLATAKAALLVQPVSKLIVPMPFFKATIGGKYSCDPRLDTGAACSIMTRAAYEAARPSFGPHHVSEKLADISIKMFNGATSSATVLARDVPVHLGTGVYPVDFLIVESGSDPFVLGSDFILIYGVDISLRDGSVRLFVPGASMGHRPYVPLFVPTQIAVWPRATTRT
jgi:hypothetical protein